MKTKFIVMQANLGLGHKGEIIITTQERHDNHLPPIAKDIVDLSFAKKIVEAMNNYSSEMKQAVKNIKKTKAYILQQKNQKSNLHYWSLEQLLDGKSIRIDGR